MEKHGKDLLKKKEAKLAKIQEKRKFTTKVIKEKALLHEQKIEEKKKHVWQQQREHMEHGEELF
jgi:hypothetical protein